MISEDVPGTSVALFDKIGAAITAVKENDNNIRILLQELDSDIIIPREATLRISYKQQREVEKLEFKIFWELREGSKLEANQKHVSPAKSTE
jgi:predicted transcriptional regulator